VATPSGLIHRLQQSLPWRAWQRYGQARGGVLAGGMAYVAFFSLLPALAVGFTVFGLIVGDDAELQRTVIDSVNDGIGTTIITPPGGTGGVVDMATLTGSSELTIAGLIGLVGLLFTGLGWLDAMREGIRAMFGQPTLEGNVVKTKLRDLLVLVTIGVVLLASAIGGVVVSSATGALLRWVGLEGSTPGRLLLGAVSTLLLLAVDVLVFMVIFRLLSGVKVPPHDFWDAALFGGIGLGILKLFAGVLLNSAGNNKLLATAGVFLGLLVWLNLISRLTLVAAAWGATVAIDRGHLAEHGMGLPAPAVPVQRVPAGAQGSRYRSGGGSGAAAGGGGAGAAAGAHGARGAGGSDGKAAVGSGAAGSRGASGSGAGHPRDARPAAAARPDAVGTAVGVPAPAAVFTPVVSPRAADRISVVAGAVLGVAGLFAARTAAGAVRSVVDAARRSPDS
jgi:membrane protein